MPVLESTQIRRADAGFSRKLDAGDSPLAPDGADPSTYVVATPPVEMGCGEQGLWTRAFARRHSAVAARSFRFVLTTVRQIRRGLRPDRRHAAKLPQESTPFLLDQTRLTCFLTFLYTQA